MSEFSRELTRDCNDIGVRALARAVWASAGHVSNLRSGRTGPSPEIAALLDAELGAGGRLAALVPAAPKAGTASEEIAAIELARRAGASDVSDGTCERLEMAVDDLATAYPRTPPGELLPRVEAHTGYTTQLVGGKATLKQRKRLLVSCDIPAWSGVTPGQGASTARHPQSGCDLIRVQAMVIRIAH